jgi:hypothetical protein
MAPEIPRLPSRSAIAYALAQLVADEHYPETREGILTLLDVPNGGFVGTHASLNVLVEYGREFGRAALDPVWTVVERKRRTPLDKPDKPDKPAETPGSFRDRKTAYQAAYMAARRARLRKATELHQKLHGKPMETQQRRDFQNSIHTTWMLWRNEMLEGVPPGEQRNEITQLFWADIDDLLRLGLNGDTDAARKVLAEE